jgi:hypothetical protein
LYFARKDLAILRNFTLVAQRAQRTFKYLVAVF